MAFNHKNTIVAIIAIIGVSAIIGVIYEYNTGTDVRPMAEIYRPRLHFSPTKGWMNDPNGLIHHKGYYHLFYQYFPNGTEWGPMHWGHAISPDLFHWQHLPIALYPQSNEFIFSGSAIIDRDNVTGLRDEKSPNETMLAFFTAHTNPSFVEKQWMAFSGNDGLEWRLFDDNPIIPSDGIHRDFRDPKVFKYRDFFVMVVVIGNQIQIYNSNNLKNWTLMSTFGENDGSHQGVWECPDLFPIVHNNEGIETEHWVLLISTGETTNTSTGPNMQYFIGSFDGQTFTNANQNDTVLWLDYGPDSYAGITYNAEPDEPRIFIAWMNRWDYANDLSKLGVRWNGQMTVPRRLTLQANHHSSAPLLLSSMPVQEIESLRITSFAAEEQKISANIALSVNLLTQITTNLLDIELTVDLNGVEMSDRFGFEFKGVKDSLRVLYNGSYVIDRSKAGRHDFSGHYGLVYRAPRLATGDLLRMRLVLDESSVELFADNGLTVMTSLFFTEEQLIEEINLFYDSFNSSAILNVIELNVSQMSGAVG